MPRWLSVLQVFLLILLYLVSSTLYLVVGEDGLGPLAKLPVGEVLQLTPHIFTVSVGEGEGLRSGQLDKPLHSATYRQL